MSITRLGWYHYRFPKITVGEPNSTKLFSDGALDYGTCDSKTG